MPPLTRRTEDRQLQVMVANPAARSHAVASGQQVGTSGTIPGTSSDPTQVATLTGTIQQSPSVTSLSAAASAGDTSITVPYSIPSGSYVVIDQNTSTSTQETGLTSGVSGSGPYTVELSASLGYPHASGAPVQAPTTSPNGDRIAGVGHAVLNNAGNPVVVMGNLNAISGGAGSKLPSSFQDGGFSFVDAQGNQVAGYSQETGLYGFGGGAVLSTFSDEVRGSEVLCTAGTQAIADCTGASSPPSWFDASTGQITEPGLYLAIPGVTLQAAGSATGKYAWWSSDFDFQGYIPLDGFSESFPIFGSGAPLVSSNAQSLGPHDVPYYVSTGLYLPSSATGWELYVNMVLGRLAYSS